MGVIRGKLLLIVLVLAFAVPSFGGDVWISIKGIELQESGESWGHIYYTPFSVGGSAAIVTLMAFTDIHVGDQYGLTGSCGGFACLTFPGRTEIVGGIPSLGIPPGTTLLKSTSGGASPAFIPFGYGDYYLDVVLSGSAVLDPTLLAGLGVPANPEFSLFGEVGAYKDLALSDSFNCSYLPFPDCLDPYNGGVFHVYGADVYLATTTPATPEPVSIVLMGTFLTMGGGLWCRKRRA